MTEALSRVQDTKIFRNESIRSIISFRWTLAVKFVYYKQARPYFFFLLSYFIYTFLILHYDRSYILTKQEDPEFDYPLIFKILHKLWLLELCAFSLYFLKNEYKQLQTQKCEYFSSPWNYADFTPPIGIILIAILDFCFPGSP